MSNPENDSAKRVLRRLRILLIIWLVAFLLLIIWLTFFSRS